MLRQSMFRYAEFVPTSLVPTAEDHATIWSEQLITLPEDVTYSFLDSPLHCSAFSPVDEQVPALRLLVYLAPEDLHTTAQTPPLAPVVPFLHRQKTTADFRQREPINLPSSSRKGAPATIHHVQPTIQSDPSQIPDSFPSIHGDLNTCTMFWSGRWYQYKQSKGYDGEIIHCWKKLSIQLQILRKEKEKRYDIVWLVIDCGYTCLSDPGLNICGTSLTRSTQNEPKQISAPQSQMEQ